jgi:hypothetical protein
VVRDKIRRQIIQYITLAGAVAASAYLYIIIQMASQFFYQNKIVSHILTAFSAR